MRINYNIFRILFEISCLLTIFTGGCADLVKAPPQKQKFVLDIERTDQKTDDTKNNVLKVSRFTISRRFQGRGLVYRTDDLTYESDFYNEFFILPDIMITEQVQKWLLKSGIFAAVLDTRSRIDADYLLEAHISGLYGDYRNKNKPEAVAEIRFLLINQNTNKKSILFDKSYYADAPLETRNPQQLIKGFNTSLRHILKAFEKDLYDACKNLLTLK
jgi:ABC-type uncharacterized transport system auxiliary subunit